VTYLARKKAFSERVEAMKDYVSGRECRSRFIGRYFGDDAIGDCGICDVCLAERKRKERLVTSERDLERRLEELLKSGSWKAEEILKELHGLTEDSLWRLMGIWQAEEKVVATGDGGFRWAGKKKGPG
jgi:ATP-dependent DNA helicase RecQ